MPEIDASFIISCHNELASQFDHRDGSVLEVATFDSAASPRVLTGFYAAQQQVLDHIAGLRARAVVNLMPHLWTPVLGRMIQRRRVGYVTVIHDATPHPGDRSAYLTKWLLREARFADRVLTLSRAVADQLDRLGIIDPLKVRSLFHPDLHYEGSVGNGERRPAKPLKLLFFGRILGYKGFSILLEAVELLRAQGVHIDLGVAGMGDLREERSRLEALGAEVTNRWLDDSEVGPLFARYDAIVLSHLEASQSGVAAIAFGCRMPVIATPVAGIAEQVIDGQTGVLAKSADAPSLADAIRRLASDPCLYGRISAHLGATSTQRSMQRFISEAASEAGSISR